MKQMGSASYGIFRKKKCEVDPFSSLSAAIVVLFVFNRSRLLALRETVDAGLNASVLPVMSVASLVGFGAVVASLPAFEMVRD